MTKPEEAWFRGPENARRIDLMVKRAKEGLTADEVAELARLQRTAIVELQALPDKESVLDEVEATLAAMEAKTPAGSVRAESAGMGTEPRLGGGARG